MWLDQGCGCMRRYRRFRLETNVVPAFWGADLREWLRGFLGRCAAWRFHRRVGRRRSRCFDRASRNDRPRTDAWRSLPHLSHRRRVRDLRKKFQIRPEPACSRANELFAPPCLNRTYLCFLKRSAFPLFKGTLAWRVVRDHDDDGRTLGLANMKPIHLALEAARIACRITRSRE